MSLEIDNILRSPTEHKGPYDYFAKTESDTLFTISAVSLLRKLRSVQRHSRELPFMSLRLSSGLVGEFDCPGGNSKLAPKNHNEVIIGLGAAGVASLIELGGMPCVACKSSKRLLAMGGQVTEELGKLRDGIDNISNPQWLTDNYDSRRLDWDYLRKELRVSPSRFYTKQGLSQEEVEDISLGFQKDKLTVPEIGYYDPTNDAYFTRYD